MVKPSERGSAQSGHADEDDLIHRDIHRIHRDVSRGRGGAINWIHPVTPVLPPPNRHYGT
ncbi:hypothetical protein SNL152K_8925 [Streptomyces sp. NL15-2K]|nr:hypothetical protein SNL152K_8925 [Streptomyces sp. NL15-2K]